MHENVHNAAQPNCVSAGYSSVSVNNLAYRGASVLGQVSVQTLAP